MSTYEDEHNLSTSDTATTSQGSRRSERHLTLQQAINAFFTSSSSHGGDFREFTNSEGLSIEPQMLDMLQSMLITGNGAAIAFGDSNKKEGVDDSFMDTLERVDKKELKNDDTCPICTNDYKDDPYRLVVELPCNAKHRFDLECIGPWLKLNKTCPLCRVDVTKGKPKELLIDSEIEDDDWEMYG